MVELLIPHTSQCMTMEGYNMSLIVHPTDSDKYLATIRRVEMLSEHEYPAIQNTTYLYVLDKNFIVQEMRDMREALAKPRQIHTSYSRGLEDCRLIDSTYFMGVLLDASDLWVPQMFLGKYHWQTGHIEELIPMKSEDEKPQKNWLVLHSTTTHFYVLHSYDPFKIITVEKDSGEQRMVHYQKVFSLENCEMHGGGCTYLSQYKKYIVCVRVVYEHFYQYSLWLLLNEKFKIVGSSEPFHFFMNLDSNSRHYEMCMCLLEKNDRLIASVSLNDQQVHIMQYKVSTIIDSISEKQLIQN